MFKKGDMVECVNEGDWKSLTNGKVYAVVKDSNSCTVGITDDDGDEVWYSIDRFKKVTEPTPSPIKAGDTVECMWGDMGKEGSLHVDHLYVVKAVDAKSGVIKVGDIDYWYATERFKKVNKPKQELIITGKQEKAKGECSMIYSTIIVTKNEAGEITAVTGEELVIAKNRSDAVVKRSIKDAVTLKGKPEKSVSAESREFQGV